MCLFLTNLRTAEKEWRNNFPLRSITSFIELIYAFYNQFVAGKKRNFTNSSFLGSKKGRSTHKIQPKIQLNEIECGPG